MSKYVFIIILLLFTAAYAQDYDSGTVNVHVKIEGFRNDKGHCYLLLFKDKKGFPESEKHTVLILKNSINDKTAAFEFEIGPGIYAISAFHDENLNKKLDKTWYGKPVEGFGISNNPKIHFGPPGFRESSVAIKEKNNFVRIIINYY